MLDWLHDYVQRNRRYRYTSWFDSLFTLEIGTHTRKFCCYLPANVTQHTQNICCHAATIHRYKTIIETFRTLRLRMHSQTVSVSSLLSTFMNTKTHARSIESFTSEAMLRRLKIQYTDQHCEPGWVELYLNIIFNPKQRNCSVHEIHRCEVLQFTE